MTLMWRWLTPKERGVLRRALNDQETRINELGLEQYYEQYIEVDSTKEERREWDKVRLRIKEDVCL